MASYITYTPQYDNDRQVEVHATPPISVYGAARISAAATPPAADGATAIAASAAGAGTAADTDAGVDDAHTSGASNADAGMAVDMAAARANFVYFSLLKRSKYANALG